MAFLENYTDERAMHLPFLQSPLIPLLYIIVYLVAIAIGQRLMKTRKPFHLKKFMGVYNLVQIVICAIIFVRAFLNGYQLDFIWRCNEGDSSRSEAAMNTLRCCYYTWLLKGVEMIETIVFVLRKKDKQVSFLHVYHHITTYILTWFFARSVGGGMMCTSVVINSIVHILMYTYYFLTLFGPAVQRKIMWFKKSITSIQIIQFVILIVNALIACNPSCGSPKWFLAFYLPNIVFLFCMFIMFYIKNYLKRKADNVKNK